MLMLAFDAFSIKVTHSNNWESVATSISIAYNQIETSLKEKEKKKDEKNNELEKYSRE